MTAGSDTAARAQAVAAMRVDEEFQIRFWGLVEGGHDVDRAHQRTQMHAGATFLNLLDDSSDVLGVASGGAGAARGSGAGADAEEGVDLEDFVRDLEAAGSDLPSESR